MVALRKIERGDARLAAAEILARATWAHALLVVGRADEAGEGGGGKIGVCTSLLVVV